MTVFKRICMIIGHFVGWKCCIESVILSQFNYLTDIITSVFTISFALNNPRYQSAWR